MNQLEFELAEESRDLINWHDYEMENDPIYFLACPPCKHVSFPNAIPSQQNNNISISTNYSLRLFFASVLYALDVST